jgi:hypothetical protein
MTEENKNKLTEAEMLEIQKRRQEVADRNSKPTLLSVTLILGFWAVVAFVILIFLGIIDVSGPGPCEQYQTDAAFEACADSVINGG